ncbi:MAG: hypothetical protein DRN15_03035 [Thermoprotei archaeon]|nr:MAG: hypothetical protein DRN15_03035 [Thermoprotei archaeon]RLF25054.1 MAG: hypothetical protein DRM97_02510 [Thermoprotei archaeon]
MAIAPEENEVLLATKDVVKLVRRPLGMLLSEDPKTTPHMVKSIIELFSPPLLITVGDFVSQLLERQDIVADVMILDGRIMRRKSYHSLEEGSRRIIVTANPPSCITYNSWKAVEKAISSPPSLLKVQGEEDLLTLAAIYISPLNSFIIYGQPREGMVLVIANEEKKLYIARIIASMERRRLNEPD